MPDESDPANTTPFQRLTRNENLQSQPSLAFDQIYALLDQNFTIIERPRAGGLLPGGVDSSVGAHTACIAMHWLQIGAMHGKNFLQDHNIMHLKKSS